MIAGSTESIAALISKGEASLQTGPFGTQLRAADYVNSGVPVINVRNIGLGTLKPDKLEYISDATRDRLSAHVLQQGDVVFGRKGAVERHVLIRGDQHGWFQGSDCIRLRILSSRILPEFASYFFLTPDHRRWMGNQCSHAATMASLNQDILGRIELPVPPLLVQRRVVDVLSAYDDLVENCERRIRVLDDMARTLYREWFVLFRYPGHAKALMQPVATLGEFENTDEVEFQTGPFGTQLRASDYSDRGIPVINVRNIGLGGVRAGDLEFLSDEQAQKHARHRLVAGDIVFGRKGAVDRHMLVGSNEEGWIQGSDCIRMRLRSRRLSPALLSFGFRQEKHKEWMLRQCSGAATMASLNQDILRRIPVVVPPADALAAFDAFANAVISESAILSTQIHNLRKTRDLLLPRLLSGQLPLETPA